ncbi:HsdR family type I site-specific deoxyribonuclease [Methanocaldococcus indicus]|uniref:HsdR family type I site-specific deoxyribonuclease n=1 Tax=Methanocaldococcus indicus TaxID=213231 RepID=UPI003C6DB511
MPVPEYKVHNKIINNLESLGWKELKNYYDYAFTDYIIIPILEKQLKNINTNIDEEFINKAIDKLRNAKPEEVLDFLKNGILVEIDKGRKGIISKTVKLIDYNNIDNNVFNYAHELKFKGKRNIKPDFTLFINGIPILIIEAKREFTEEDSYLEAIKQIHRYEREAPDLFKYVQIGIAYADEKLYLPTYPNYEGLERHTKPYKWKNIKKEEDIFDLLKRERLLDIICNFILYRHDSKKELSKVVPRYIQYFAVNKAFKRVSDYLNNKTNKNRGLIWHWQGSGKTFEIIYLAELFYKIYKNRNPIVFIVVDRIELEEQFNEIILSLKNVTFRESYKKIESIKELKELLLKIKESEKNKNISVKGVYLLMMHKFNENSLKEELENLKIDKKEILILRDEVHRTESGKLATLRNYIFKNAILIGFTGTPIHKADYSTFKEFAYPPEEFYLDVFFIRDSINEKFTLPLIWRPVKFDIFLNVSEEKIKVDIENLFLNPDEDIKITISDVLKSENTIKKAVKYIAEHIKEDTENFKFKAMIITQDRKSCILYKKYLDKYFDEEFSQVVITHQHNDDEEIKNFKEKMEEKYKLNIDKLNKLWTDNFKNKEYPKVLIVNRKLLTGFDAPILKVLYIHQFLKDSLLLQASARANRPDINKNYGLIVDLTGILIENYKKAVEKYELYIKKEISEDIIENLFIDSKLVWKAFLEKFNDFKELFKKITNMDFESFINNIEEEKLSYEDVKYIITKIVLNKEFLIIYNQLRDLIKLFEVIGAYPDKIKYYKIYDYLRFLYSAINKQIKPKRYTIPKDIKEKFLKYLEFSDFETLKLVNPDDIKSLPIYKKEVIFADFLFTLMDMIKDKKDPIYRRIYKKLKEIKDRYIKKLENIENLLNETIFQYKIVKEYEDKVKNLPIHEIVIFNIYLYLKDMGYDNISLSKTKEELKSLENKDFLLPGDIEKIKKALLIDLLKAKKGLNISHREIKELSNKLYDEVVKVILMG